MIFFFYGPNSYAAHKQVHQMIAAYIKKTGSDLGIERVDGTAVQAKSLASILQASPFLATSRLVIIEQLSGNKLAVDMALSLLDHVPATTVVVFAERDVDQRTTYFKTMSKLPKVVKFELLSSTQLRQWIDREIKTMGGSIERPATERLLEMVGDDQWRMDQEIAKLINYRPQVTLEAVNLLVVPSPTQTIFDLVDAMAGGNTARAIGIYHELLRAQTNEVYILSMIIWQLRSLLLAKTAGPITQADLAKSASISPFVAGKAQAKSRAIPEETLKAAFLAAVDTDYQLKTGAGEPAVLVEKLIYHISASLRSASVQ